MIKALIAATAIGLSLEWVMVWLVEQPLAGFLCGVACIAVCLCMHCEVEEDRARLIDMS
jgi:hypothetical protein